MDNIKPESEKIEDCAMKMKSLDIATLESNEDQKLTRRILFKMDVTCVLPAPLPPHPVKGGHL